MKDNKGRKKESWLRWVSNLSPGRGWRVREAGEFHTMGPFYIQAEVVSELRSSFRINLSREF